ncbi:MAG TPA: c-type cytochrome [Ramlibacter sp.]|jgi:cytochrome c553|nr:c-type cytochrome [Ramlibacter sp.]
MRVEALLRGSVAAILLAASASALPQQAPPPQVQLCMACHGPQGNSQIPTTPSLAGQPKLFIENQLVLIREGMRVVPEMKGMLDGMKDAEIVELAGWFALQKPVPAQPGAPEPAKFQRGQSLAAKALCGSCHLPDYSGRQQIPRLAGQHEIFLLQSMKQFRDRPEPGRDTIMAASLHGIKDDELADIAHYLAHLR